MKKIFLAASFADVSSHLAVFLNESLQDRSVAFIATASLVEDYRGYVENDRLAFKNLGLNINELDISHSTFESMKTILSESDYIFISGGNTFYLLQELRRTGADQLISDWINRGKPYIGSSAGSIVLAPDIDYIQLMDDINKAPQLSDTQGLNLIDFYPLPHFNNEPFIEIAHQIYTNYFSQLSLKPIDNDQFIIVDDQ